MTLEQAAVINLDALPANWWTFHHYACGTGYRGCSPQCPKRRIEERMDDAEKQASMSVSFAEDESTTKEKQFEK